MTGLVSGDGEASRLDGSAIGVVRNLILHMCVDVGWFSRLASSSRKYSNRIALRYISKAVLM